MTENTADRVHELKQTAFNKVYNHLIKQGKPAIDDKGKNRYRVKTEDGILRCAIGVLISDEEYSLSIEGMSVTALLKNGVSLFPHAHTCLDLLQDLQRMHDSGKVYTDKGGYLTDVWSSEDRLRSGLREIALKHGLKTPRVLRKAA